MKEFNTEAITDDEILLTGSKYEVAGYLGRLIWLADRPPAAPSIRQSTGRLRMTVEALRQGREPLEPPVERDEKQAETDAKRHYAEIGRSIEKGARAHRPTEATQVQIEWSLSLSGRFAKSALKLDRKLQGRILEALLELCEAPDTPIGDTIKPLAGDRRGEWRYRIGDYRVVYRPNRETHEVLLLEVAPRGGAYS